MSDNKINSITTADLERFLLGINEKGLRQIIQILYNKNNQDIEWLNNQIKEWCCQYPIDY